MEGRREELLRKERDVLDALVDVERSMALNRGRERAIEVERGFLVAQVGDLKERGRRLTGERGVRREKF